MHTYKITLVCYQQDCVYQRLMADYAKILYSFYLPKNRDFHLKLRTKNRQFLQTFCLSIYFLFVNPSK